MRTFIVSLTLWSLMLVTCHKIEKREVDEEGYDWDAGLPHYEHFHYDESGEIDFAPRIIGGTPSWHGEFPAKISLQTRGGAHFCGGALIDLRHVLTAAHCLVTDFGHVFNPDSIRLMGDDVSIQRWGANSRQLRFASHLFVHPSFDLQTYANDIAVIRVSTPFTASTTLRSLPRAFSTPFDNTNCNLAGWGATHEDNTRAHPILLRVELEVIPMNFCNGSSSFNGIIPQGFFCAGSLDGTRDACFGDSGGGLICHGQIAGIVSFGFGCGRRNFPGGYVDVSQYNHWIAECIASNLPNQDIPRPRPSPDPKFEEMTYFIPDSLLIYFLPHSSATAVQISAKVIAALSIIINLMNRN